MPLNLSNLQSDTATCRVDYGEAGDINIVYRPSNLTERTIRQLRSVEGKQIESMEDIDTGMSAINAVLLQLIVSWDLQRDGVTIPLTDDALSDVPIDVRSDVMRAMFEEARLGEPSGAPTPRTSPATSARKARRS